MPPEEGFAEIQWQRILLKKPWSSFKLISVYVLITAGSYYFYAQNVTWKRNIKRIKTSITFLGYQFSRYGGLNIHVDQLRCRAFKKINLLKALSSKSFWTRYRHIVNLEPLLEIVLNTVRRYFGLLERPCLIGWRFCKIAPFVLH